MSENPYEPPKGEPEPKVASWRRSVTMTVLGFLAVPAAAIAGGGTCIGSSRVLSFLAIPWRLGVLVTVAASVAVVVTILMAVRYWLRESQNNIRYDATRAAIGAACATPFAMLVSFALFYRGYYLANFGGDGSYYFVTGLFLAFFLWSLGAWIGLRTGSTKEQATVKNP